MTFKEELEKFATDTFGRAWTITDGRKIPTADSAVGLGNVAVKLDATVLYADLADSTGLVRRFKRQYAAEVYKTFVYSAARCIRYHGGEVTAYDGDRVMGVFIGAGMESAAVRASFRLKGIVDEVLKPISSKRWTGEQKLDHKCGIDKSELWVANTGIRGNTDYVWVGNAANNAAKMAALGATYKTYVTEQVHVALDANIRVSAAGSPFFHRVANTGLDYTILGSNAFISS